MAPRSPSLAFEPTPAIDGDKESTPLSSEDSNMISFDNRDSRRQSTKEVHFTSVTSPVRRAQSLATSVPLLEPIRSASQLPRQTHHSKGVTSSIDIDAYIEQSRTVLDKQRQNFERERKAFEHERILWEAERVMLRSKIADLEMKATKSRDTKRSYSDNSNSSSPQSFRSNFAQLHSARSDRESQGQSRANTAPPVWEGPETPAPATRVFTNESPLQRASGHLAVISEDDALPALEREISPRSKPPARSTSVSVPIDKLDRSLDGITLKSTALAPSFVANVLPAQSETPPRTPSPDSRSAANPGLRVEMDGVHSPFDENLKLNAGHTPMAFGNSGSNGSGSKQSTGAPTPNGEGPIAPVPSVRPPSRPHLRPSEGSDSYFSNVPETEDEEDDNIEDPALKRPLTLDSKNKENANSFLSEVDARLLMEAQKYLTSPESAAPDAEEKGTGQDDDDMPKLKMKQSRNFGSAFGSDKCGKV